MKYKYLLWDIDGTVLDFAAAEKEGLKRTCRILGWKEFTDEQIARYSAINDIYWQLLEKNQIEKGVLLVKRFEDFFAELSLSVSEAARFNAIYQQELGETYVFCDDCEGILKGLKGKCLQAAVSNGTKEAQRKKLAKSGLDRVFDYIFISDEMGVEKPNKGFFDTVFAVMGISDPKEALIIGDSLTSDIKGGINCGIDTCHYNPKGKPGRADIVPKYEIRSLQNIKEVLGI